MRPGTGSAPEGNTYPAYPEMGEAGGDGLQLEQLVGIARRRKWLILATALLGTVVGLLVGLQQIPKYTAKALLLIDPRQSKVVDFQAVMAGLSTDAASVETQIKVLESRNHLGSVAESLGLDRDPEFNPPIEQPTAVVLTVGQPWQQLLGWLPEPWLIATGLAEEPPPGFAAADVLTPLSSDDAPKVTTVAATGNGISTDGLPADGMSTNDLAAMVAGERAVARLEDGFKISQEGRSYVLGVSFTSTSPEKAARIANKSVELYIQEQVEQKQQATGKASSWLSERLVSLKAEVERAEAAVQDYRISHKLTAVGRTDVNDQQISDINSQLVNATAEAAGRQARLAFIHDLRKRGESVDSLPEVMGSPLILNLRSQETELLRAQAELASSYGDKHPKIQLLKNEQQKLEDKINREIDRIVANLENESKILAARIGSMQTDLGKAQNISGQAQTAEVKLAELEREATASRQLYENLLQRYKETSAQQELVEPDAQVLAQAVPPGAPSTKGAKFFALIGFTLSTGLGGMLAFLMERLDKGIRSERDVHEGLGLPRLSLVPQLQGLGRGRPHQYLLKRPFSAYTEAMRAILAALRLGSAAEDQPKLILVTSSVPEEGKTTLSVSLATYAAFAGQRVLLIDLDLRRPSVLRELGVTAEAGIVEHVLGDLPLESVVQHVADLKLDYLPAFGSTSTDPMPLINSPRMADLLRRLRAEYDWVFIDSPPLLGVTDAQVLSSMIDKVLFVVRWGSTKRSIAQSAVGILQDARADVAGVVLTQVDIKKHAQYSYGDVGDYYSNYRKYYVN